ncbi:MAG: rod shape-determining protein RodA [Cloacibacterium sp.]|jgi:rod shape determining protein RodA|nr:rod shape-determining protein RodA [Cloacibacterium sp.]
MKWAEGLDKLGIFLYLAISIFAVVNIYSVDSGLGEKQLIFFFISLFVGLIIFMMRSKFFENFAVVFFILGVVSLLGLHVLGSEIKGQKNWYKIGGFTIQPVEFAKIGISLMLASYVSGPDFNLNNRKSFLTTLAIIGVPAIAVLSIPDVGSLLVFTTFIIALYREGLSGWLFGIGFTLAAVFLLSIAFNPLYIILGLLFILVLFLLFNFNRIVWTIPTIATFVGGFLLLSGISYGTPKILEKLPKHQRERIEVLYKGEKAFRDTSGYNLLYSKTAIGSGGVFGKGYKQGSVTQGKFVPEQETDYIFCTVGEEWGFLGSSLLVIFYAVYIGRIYYLAENQKTTFNRVFGYCFAGVLLMHFAINLGMVMGLFPTVGIPLPYFSYGGSSFLAFSIMTAIFFKLNYTDKNSLV